MEKGVKAYREREREKAIKWRSVERAKGKMINLGKVPG